jgi:hypothetical protein
VIEITTGARQTYYGGAAVGRGVVLTLELRGLTNTTTSPAAERMRRSRQRRRDGLRSLRIELRETEIDKLIRSGFLDRASCNDANAVLGALYRVFDRIFA